jgi:DNA-binding transcriptional LysR family regulator
VKSKLNSLGHRVDLNLLVVFDAIYRSRNLTAAGKVLALNQPAMSHALGRLRSTFNDPLFVRLPRGLQPTPKAEEIAPSVMEGLAIIRGSLDGKTFEPERSTRTFNIAQGDIAEAVHLPRLMSAVSRAAPNVRVHTFDVPGPRLRDALGDGEVDVAAGDYDLGAGCREALLYEAEYVCVVRADHPTIGARLTLKQFQNLRHIFVNPRTATQHGSAVERVLTRRDVAAKIAVEVSHFNGVAALVTSSDMIATIPSRFARALARYTNIKVLSAPVSFPTLRVWLYWHERFHREAGNVWLRDVYLSLF